MHTICPVKSIISRYSDVDDLCSFCKIEEEVLTHVFFYCNITQVFWKELATFIFSKVKDNFFSLKDIIVHNENNAYKDLEYVVNLFILQAKFYIHKQKYVNLSPIFKVVLAEFECFISSLKLLKKQKVINMFKAL